MKKKILFLAATVVCLAGLLALHGCTTEERSGEALPVDALAYEVVEAQAPKGYKIYLDGSGSMPGYFKEGLTDYISLVANIENVADSAAVYFWGDTNRPVKDLNSTITKGNYSASASLFWEIFAQMAKEVRTDSLMTFLVTDGIVSNCRATTKQRSGYSIGDLPLVEGKVKASIGEGLAVGVFRFYVPFSGTYYDIDNKTVELPETTRPLYVFAIGTPGNLAEFKEKRMSRKEMKSFNAKLKKSIWLGLLSKSKDNSAYGFQDGISSFETDSTEEGTLRVILPAGTDDLNLTVDLPDWMEKYGININSFDRLELKSNSKDFSKKLDKSYVHGKIEIVPSNGESNGDSSFIDLVSDDYTLSYSIVYTPSKEWDQFSSEDDRNIKNDANEQAKTFGLKEMIKGFELATKQPDIIFQTSLKFKSE